MGEMFKMLLVTVAKRDYIRTVLSFKSNYSIPFINQLKEMNTINKFRHKGF